MARIEYNEVAPDYERGRGLAESGLSGWRDALRPYLEGLQLPLVDIGSGAGQFAPLLSNWFDLDVVGVEPSDGMRAVAEAANASPRVRYLAGDAEHLPLEDGLYCAAWVSTVIHHIPDLAAAAAEIRRVLAAGAPLLIRSAFPGRTAGISLFRYFPEAAAVVETFPSIEAVERTFGGAGFVFEGVSAVPQETVGSLREFRERVALRADTTLRGISDEAFAAGLSRLDVEIEAEGTPDGPLTDWLDLVVLRSPR